MSRPPRPIVGSASERRRAVLGVLVLLSCRSEAPPESGPRVVADVAIEILNPDRREALRCNPEVEIAEKVSAEALVALTRGLLEEEARGCGFGFVAYYLPAMRPGSGAWAIAELGPEITVSILGLSTADEGALIQRAQANGENFGVWIDDTSYASVLALYRDGAGLKLGRFYPDGGQAIEPIRITKSGGGYELRDAAAPNGDRHYRLGADGELETWDSAGFLAAARQVRLEVDLAALAAEETGRRARRARVASAGRSLARAAAAEERWRKFSEWLTLYRASLDPGRHLAVFLSTPQSAAERTAACGRLREVLAALPATEVKAAPSRRIDVDPLLKGLVRLQDACAKGREIQVLLEAAAAGAEWRELDRVVEQVVSELRPEEE